MTTVGARIAQILLQLAAVAILARILTPEDYGVQAMVMPVALLAGQIANTALQSAVIHHESLSADEANTLFWSSVRFNLAVAGVMALLSPALALLYGDARVTWVGVTWALVIYLATLASIPEALLKRQMRFGVVVAVQLSALCVSIVAAVIAALLGAGYWALLVQISVLELTRASVIWAICPWRPRWRTGRTASHGTAAMHAYWRNLSGARVVGWLGDHADRLLVGTLGGAPVLGLYDAAKRWAWIPFIELYVALTDVAVATLSRVRHDAARYREFLRNIVLPIYSAAVPAIVYIFVEATTIVRFLLGDRWTAADLYLRVMCVASLGASLSRLSTWLYLTTGETRRQLRWTFLTTPVMLLALMTGARWGARGVAVAFAGATCLLALPSVANATRGSAISARDLLRTFARPFTAAALAALFVWIAGPARHAAPFVAILVRLPVFLIVYATAWIVLPGGRSAIRALWAGRRAVRESAVTNGVERAATPAVRGT